MAIYGIFSTIFGTFYCPVSLYYYYFRIVRYLILSARHDEDELAMLDTQLILHPLFQPPPQQATTKFLRQRNLMMIQMNLKILLFGRIPPKIQTLPHLSDLFQFETAVRLSPTVHSNYHQTDIFLPSVLIRLSRSLHHTS